MAPRRLTELLFAVAEDADVDDKALAWDLGYSRRYLSKIRTGEKALQFDRIAQLPPDLRRELWRRVAEEDGLQIVSGNPRRQAFGRLLVAMSEAMEHFDEPQLQLPLRAGKPLKVDLK